MRKKIKRIAATAFILAVVSAITPVSALADEPYESRGYFSEPETLTWKAKDGTVTTYGRGPVFSDIHPEITDPEYYLKELVLYPGEEIGAVNSQGVVKGDYTDGEEEELKKFLHSFDWIHSDELTRAMAIYERISNGHSGNVYGRPEEEYRLLKFSVLMGGKGICSNFADEYARMARLVGLESETYRPGLNHEACLVKISGQWFRVDPTYGNTFFTANDTYPVDYDTEKALYGKLVDEKWEAYFEENPESILKEDFDMMDKLARGEITIDEYNTWVLEYYK